MAVGNDKLPHLLPVSGVRLATVSAGIKSAGRKDLVLMEAGCSKPLCGGVHSKCVLRGTGYRRQRPFAAFR